MKSERIRRLAVAVAATAAAAGETGQPSAFGDAFRQTMAAQAANPAPRHETRLPQTSGEQVAQAIGRYRDGKVKQPERPAAAQTAAGIGNGSR